MNKILATVILAAASFSADAAGLLGTGLLAGRAASSGSATSAAQLPPLAVRSLGSGITVPLHLSSPSVIAKTWSTTWAAPLPGLGSASIGTMNTGRPGVIYIDAAVNVGK